MAHLQIRDIPDDVRDVLAQRAQDRGQSPNAYLREVIVREALFANNQAPIDRVAAYSGSSKFTSEDVLAARDAARGERPEGAG
jgi:antitoxin FitA